MTSRQYFPGTALHSRRTSGSHSTVIGGARSPGRKACAVPREVQWRTGDRFVGYEAPPCHMIARIEAIKGEPHAFQFFDPISVERSFGFVALAPRSLLGDKTIESGIGDKSFSMVLHSRTEVRPRIRQYGVDKALSPRSGRSDGQARSHNRFDALRPNPTRQHVGPIF